MSAEERLSRVFVELADTLVADFDVIDFLHTLTERCAELLEVDAAGILLTDQRDHLQLVAASTLQVEQLELFQLQSERGPCLDCFTTGEPVACPDLRAAPQRWPEFAAAAAETGFVAVHALPMRLRERVIGALNLFSARPDGLNPATTALCQAFADVATIGILAERSTREQQVLSQQLQSALNTRIIIEQAKGLLAERRGLSMDESFTALRGYARSHNRKLTEVALALIEGDETVADLAHPPQPS
ncbi:GAF and ANTAR domain-containing protein [Actinomadura sp. DC4]|uniref:GAF and ANTAR domain-containing protein n=1 Tax=Actinomadura sp. DC4 TaxID=3055069 RepID=UPI0025B2698B|nr:GAF and ANTAR domain-containing protein [Actinomadura sp. DC4]MDN3352274.1 GAF and ANTAR domain-containing protein [Actinomadura sp. DC4]